jgi:arylsulfatase A-like enzyme
VQTEAALAFVKRNKSKPFFLYLCYYAPHTPLELAKPHVDGFTGEMALRRRAALSMIAGIDAGVGKILSALKDYGIDERTLLFFTSDNGAPVHGRRDSPLDKDMGGWDGSLNTPWVGEKGMLSEGGIRVPFVLRWRGTLPAGKVYSQPVSSLDIAATANALARLPTDKHLDGVNLIPFLNGRETGAPHGALYWRFWSQAAVRDGRWKLLYNSQEPDKLFDLESDEHERRDLAAANPEKAAALRRKLESWTMELEPKGMPGGKLNDQERGWFREYFTNHASLVTKP